MAKYEAIDCQGFAGGFTLGTVQAGFRLVGKREHPGGFGAPACEANRHLLGEDWETQASQAAAWEARDVPYVFGNPPCSGFSLLSPSSFRGQDSKVNSCMWDFVGFAARCGPQVAVFESVSQAYKQGRELMTGLRADLENRTGDQWHLTHVLHNAYSLGGAAIRRRYFFVVHRIPFGVEPYELRRLPVLRDVIGDLGGGADTWETQPYRRPASWWSESRRAKHGFDGHKVKWAPHTLRSLDLLGDGIEWGIREPVSVVAAKYWEKHRDFPESWRHLQSYNKWMAEAPNFSMGFNQLFRWDWEQNARVVTGGALNLVMHPDENRTITHREAVRIMGFPDDWRLNGLRSTTGLAAFWGKGIPVDCGRWISGWVKNSLDGNPGTLAGEEVGDRETLIDVTNDYKRLV